MIYRRSAAGRFYCALEALRRLVHVDATARSIGTVTGASSWPVLLMVLILVLVLMLRTASSHCLQLGQSAWV